MTKVFNRLIEILGLNIVRSTVTAAAGAATLNANGVIEVTTEALTTAQDAVYTLTLTNNRIFSNSAVFASLKNGSNTQGTPLIQSITEADGSVVIKVINKHASAEALNGTLKLKLLIVNAQGR